MVNPLLSVCSGSDHRIRSMISKGASEAMLNAFVNAGRDCSPNYAILVPLLNTLAKVGHRGEDKGNNELLRNAWKYKAVGC